MSLVPGSKLGPYETLAAIGAGGIKTALGGFGERFEHEAWTIAALSRPSAGDGRERAPR
jgi:hypothetical protein